jgi:hypothetical protein
VIEARAAEMEDRGILDDGGLMSGWPADQTIANSGAQVSAATEFDRPCQVVTVDDCP